MAAPTWPSAFPLHRNARLLDEPDRMLFQHSHQAGADPQRAALQERPEGASAPLLEQIQPESAAVHLDKGAGTFPANHRNNQAVPSGPSEETAPKKGARKYYKGLTVRCTSPDRNTDPKADTLK